jgi:hypothetical protein
MLRHKKAVIIAGGLMAFAIAGAVLAYSGLRRSAAADESSAPELLSEVPAGAPTLVYADLAAIRASAFYQQRPDHGPITLPDRDYADFVQSTGFDFEKDLDRVVIASWPAGLSQEKKQTILIADGRFDRRKIHDYAVSKGKLDHQQGRDVFLFPSDNLPGGSPAAAKPAAGNSGKWNSLTFLNDHRVAIVEGASIAPLLEHSANGSGGDPAREHAARVAGAAVIAITRVPAVPDKPAPGGGQSAQFMNLARSVQWITLAARPEGNNLRISLEGECQTPDDARKLQSTLEVLSMIGSSALEGSKTRQSMDPTTFGVLEAVLKNAEVSATAERVRILVELTPDILKLGGSRKAQ